MASRKTEKKRIAVLFGGQSTEHEISLLSSRNIINAIDRQKYDLTLIGVNKNGCWILYDDENYLINADNPATISLAPARRYLAMVPGQYQAQLIDTSNGHQLPLIDVAFSVLHGANGENGSVQGLLRVLNIPYVGTDVLGSALCMDKDMTKRVLRNAGVLVTPSVTLLRTDDGMVPDFDFIVSQLGLPLFIKPVNQGSSIGVSKITNRAGFKVALALAFSYDTKILVEQAIIGREIEIAVLGNESPEVSVCGEINTNDEFYTYDTKYLKNTQTEFLIPAPLIKSVATALQKTARIAYLMLGCSVMARVDFFLTEKGQIILNEVNTMPGFTSISMYPKLWEASGLNYPTLVNHLITLALERDYTTRITNNER
ncbi:MAG: D-alanine--D-alanine ligase [Sodalis sp. (in: enterobacteria)]